MPEPLFRSRGQETIDIDPEKLKTYRKQVGISQYTLAKDTGVSRSYISDIEQGRKNPREFAAKALARRLGVTLRDLEST